MKINNNNLQPEQKQSGSSDKQNTQTPHVLNLWLKGMLKDGAVIKKKIIKSGINIESKKDSEGGIYIILKFIWGLII
jgi:hypothetical protein